MRSEKGAITLFTLLAMLFFLIFAMIVYNNVSQKSQMQIESTDVLVDEYKADTSIDSIYGETVTGTKAEASDAKTKDQSTVITSGSNDYVAIDNKIYKAK